MRRSEMERQEMKCSGVEGNALERTGGEQSRVEKKETELTEGK